MCEYVWLRWMWSHMKCNGMTCKFAIKCYKIGVRLLTTPMQELNAWIV